MGKLSVGVIALLACSCGTPGSGAPDASNDDSPDPCNPSDLVGVCPPRGVVPGPTELELLGPAPSDVVFYTLDGTLPDESSPRYDSPLLITPDPTLGGVVTLRAFALHTDGSRTRVVTHSYIFPDSVLDQPSLPTNHPQTWGFGDSTRDGDYEMDSRAFGSPQERDEAAAALTSIPSVALTMDHRDLWAPSSGIYMRPSANGSDFVRPAHVEILFPNGSHSTTAAGVSTQGNSSLTNWKAAKLSLRLRFRGEHGDGDLSAELFEDSSVTRFANLVLDAHLNNTWIHPDQVQRERGVYVQDQFVSSLLAHSGQIVPHGRPVHLYLNGLYWGLYDLHERPDEHFSSSHLGGSPDQWDVFRHENSELVAGDRLSWDEMFAIARAGLGDPARLDDIGEHLDIDGLIDYMLINFYAGNTDWDRHNWYAIRLREEGQGFRFVSWDAEHVLADVNVDVTNGTVVGGPSELYRALLANPMFTTRLRSRAGELFGPGGTLYVDADAPAWNPNDPENNQPAALFDALTQPIESQILLESARWGDNRVPEPYTRADWNRFRLELFDGYFPLRSDIAFAQIPTP